MALREVWRSLTKQRIKDVKRCGKTEELRTPLDLCACQRRRMAVEVLAQILRPRELEPYRKEAGAQARHGIGGARPTI